MTQPWHAHSAGSRIWLALLMFLFFPPRSLAGQEGPLTLQDCLSLALEQNPLVLSAREQYQASLARIRSARAFPQPSLDVDSDLMSKATDPRGADERYVGISQTIPFPGRTWLSGRIAQEESSEILADKDLLREELAFEVKSAFYGVLLARELLDYAEQNLDLSRDFVLMTETKYEAGDLAQVELVRARLEEAKAARELRVKENEVRLAQAQLNFLLARDSSEPLELEGDLRVPTQTVGLEDVIGAALVSRPEMRRVSASLERESLVKKQGYLSYLPDFDVGLAKHRQTGEGDTWDMTFSLALPVYFWQPARGEIAEASANYRALTEDAAYLVNSIALEVEESYVNLNAASDQISLFEEDILAQAQEAYEMYQFAYQQGEIEAIDLIEARRTLNEARTSYADALYTYDVARAGIEKSVGRPFEEFNNGPLQSDLVPRSNLNSHFSADSLLYRVRNRAHNRRGSGRGAGGR